VLVHQFHFLKVIEEVESYYNNASSHVYLGRFVSLGKCGRRVLQKILCMVFDIFINLNIENFK